MLAKPEGEWGMPPEMVLVADRLRSRHRKEHRRGAGHHAKARLQRRKAAADQDPDKEFADLSGSCCDPDRSIKKIYITSEIDILDTPRWYARLAKKDYTIGLNVTGVSVDDPDGNIVENYSCKSERNYTQYCNAEVDRLLVAQSSELDREKRKKMVWDIERLLVEDAARPIILHSTAGNCWQPHVKNFRPHDNSQYNNLRFEDVWLEK